MSIYDLLKNTSEMLTGNINRMILTDNLTELDKMHDCAILRLEAIYREKKRMLEINNS
jgi:hypothetical protein